MLLTSLNPPCPGGSLRPPPKIFRIFSKNTAISDPAFFANEQLFKPVLMQKTRPKSGIGCPRNRGPKKIGRGGSMRPGLFLKIENRCNFFSRRDRRKKTAYEMKLLSSAISKICQNPKTFLVPPVEDVEPERMSHRW